MPDRTVLRQHGCWLHQSIADELTNALAARADNTKYGQGEYRTLDLTPPVAALPASVKASSTSTLDAS